MHRFFVRAPFAEEMIIVDKDAHHIANVLRMQPGEELQIVSSDQVSALMRVKDITVDAVMVELVEVLEQQHEPSVELVLLQGLPKGEKIDFIVQKAVEIGVSTIVPVAMDNCVVKLTKDKAPKKVERWQKIAEEAAKQAKRDIIPKVEQVLSWQEAMSYGDTEALKIMAYEVEDEYGLRQVLQNNPDARKIYVLVGPEGGISKEEYTKAVAAGFHSVTLGTRILRTETAGLVTMAAILYEKGDFGG